MQQFKSQTAIKKGHTLTNVINLIVSLGTLALIAICITKMISTVGKRDTNDELTQQTTAKVNQTFITFLFTIACLFISVMTLFSDILGRFKVTLNEYVITGLIWFCYAVYNFIGLYFESKFDDDENWRIKMKAKKEKKKITLREYHKKRMVTGIAILVTEIFENTVEHYKLDNTTWATVIFVVLAAMTALFAVIWLYASCQKVDKEDEMAKENMLKAHQSITKMFLIILAVAIFISMFWEGSITIKINSDRLYQVWFIFWFSYMTLESGFFLHQEGKLSTDEEDE